MKKGKDGLYHQQVTINGKRKVFSSKDKHKLMLKIAQYREEKSGTPLFRDIADKWKEEHWERIELGTLRCYNAPFKRIVERFGDYRLHEITPRDISNFFAFLGKSYSYKSVSNTRTVLNQIFNYAIIDLNIDTTNPVSSVSVPKNLPKGSRTILTDHEAEEVLKTTPDEFQLAYLIYFTGLRCGEALGLQMKNIDMKSNVINVVQSIHHDGNAPKIGTLKTDNSYRQVPLPSELKARIKELDLSPEDFVVSGEKPLTKSSLDKRWKRWCINHGLTENGKPTIDRHQIRHTYTTNLYEAGVDPKSMQAILGHADLSTTLKTYTHLTQQQFQKSSAQIDKMFSNQRFQHV